MQYQEERYRQYWLYGCTRTDNVMHAKLKKNKKTAGATSG